MSRKQYPIEQPPGWRNAGKWDVKHDAACKTCGTKFCRDQLMCVIETQVNWFRGDDEVDFYCEGCASARGIKTPKQHRQKRAAEEIEAIKRNIAKPDGDTPGRRRRLAELESEIAEAVA